MASDMDGVCDLVSGTDGGTKSSSRPVVGAVDPEVAAARVEGPDEDGPYSDRDWIGGVMLMGCCDDGVASDEASGAAA